MEMLLSVSIMAVLLGAMVMSISVASRAIDDGTGPVAQTRRGAEVVEQVNADLALATAFSERTDRAVSFSVPDRDGDGNPEAIRYSWTGPEDRQLLRQINDGPAVAIAQDVGHFGLNYREKTVGGDDDDDWEYDDDGKKQKKDKGGKSGKDDDKGKDGKGGKDDDKGKDGKGGKDDDKNGKGHDGHDGKKGHGHDD